AARAGGPAAGSRSAARATTALAGASDTFVDASYGRAAATAGAPPGADAEAGHEPAPGYEPAPTAGSAHGPKNDDESLPAALDRPDAARAGAAIGPGPGTAKPTQPAGSGPRTGGRHRQRRAGTGNKNARPA